MKHLLATVGSVAAILVVGGLDHFFHSEILTALGVTLVFVTIGLIAAGALRLLWHGLQRLGVVHHGPPSFRVQDGETDIYVHRWKAFAYTVLPAAFGLRSCSLRPRTAPRGRSGSESWGRSRSPAFSSGGMGRRACSTAHQRL